MRKRIGAGVIAFLVLIIPAALLGNRLYNRAYTECTTTPFMPGGARGAEVERVDLAWGWSDLGWTCTSYDSDGEVIGVDRVGPP